MPSSERGFTPYFRSYASPRFVGDGQHELFAGGAVVAGHPVQLLQRAVLEEAGQATAVG